MPRFASRKVVVGAFAFAAAVVAVSFVGDDAGLVVLYLLYLVPALAALYLAVRWAVAAGVSDAGKRGATISTGGAREILDMRYAGGEVSREEYERVRRDLETS